MRGWNDAACVAMNSTRSCGSSHFQTCLHMYSSYCKHPQRAMCCSGAATSLQRAVHDGMRTAPCARKGRGRVVQFAWRCLATARGEAQAGLTRRSAWIGGALPSAAPFVATFGSASRKSPRRSHPESMSEASSALSAPLWPMPAWHRTSKPQAHTRKLALGDTIMRCCASTSHMPAAAVLQRGGSSPLPQHIRTDACIPRPNATSRERTEG